MESEIIVISPELKKLIDEVPVDLLRAGPERYASLRASARGSWRDILYDGVVTARAWTDWEKGFDIINVSDSAITDQLSNYVITSKALDIPASWAYTTLDRTVKRLSEEAPVTLSEQSNGKLSGVQPESTIDDKGNPIEQEQENGTEQ